MHRRGDYRWVLEVGIPRFAGGEFVGYVGTATDIHERKQMEDALRKSEASFRDLADSAPVMIWTTDERGLVTFVNAGWLAYTGTTLEEELGDTWAFGVHPEDAPHGGLAWHEALERRELWEREYRLRAEGGEYRWISERGVPRYEEGELRGLRGHRDRHPRAQDDGGAAARGLRARAHDRRDAPAQPAARAPAAHRGAGDRRPLPAGGPGRRDRRRLVRRARAPRRAGWRSWSATWSATGCAPRRSMGQLRNAFRAYGLAESSPAEVMARVNRLVMSGEEEVMATVLYLVLDRETGEVCLLERRAPAAAGARRRTAPASSRAAARCRSARSTPACSARPRPCCPQDASLLLYTDGLVERRDEPLERRLDALAEAADRAEGGLEGLCDAVLAGVLGQRMPSDDVALLAVRPRPVATESIRFTLPAEPESLPGLRRRLARFLHAAGADDAGDLRDHADRLRGGRQRDRARLRAGRRHLRRRGPPRRSTSWWRR